MSSVKANHEDDISRQEGRANESRQASEAAELAWMLRGAQDDIREELAREVRAQARLAEQAPVRDHAASEDEALQIEHVDESDDGRAEPVAQRDWSSAIDLVQEACEAIRIAEERVAELERQGEETQDELEDLRHRLRLEEERSREAEAAAATAGERAAEAEAWLARMHDAITKGLGRTLKSGAN